MIQMLKWILKGIVFGAMIFAVAGLSSSEARAEKKIGVLLWTDAQNYTDSLKGIMYQLKKEGFVEPKTTFIKENAEGDKVKASALAQKFAAAKLDMVIVIGTSAAIAAAKEIKDVPIVFSTVFDPVEAQIIKDLKSSGNNVTGASNKISMSIMMKVLKELQPVKKLGALYQPNEKNSVSHLKDLLEAQNNAQIKVVPIPITAKEDLIRLLPDALDTTDAIYICGSTIIGEMIPTVAEMAIKAKKITVTHLVERVEKGMLLGVVADSYAVGLLAGEKAVKVLKGAKPSSVPIGMLKKPELYLNMKTAKAGQFQIPPAFIKKVTKTIE
jgi:putative ABC transport system substrate-binding protein